MTTFGIVGGLGIGAAHTIAARQLGWELSWVVDIDTEKVRERYPSGGKIENHWAYIHEQADLNDGIVVAPSLHQNLKKVDVAIVCSPNHLHQYHYQDIVSMGLASRILVEKPGQLSLRAKNISTHFGYKGLRNPKITEYLDQLDLPPSKIGFMHEYPPTHRKWNDHIVQDLGSHALSFIAHRWNHLLQDAESSVLYYEPDLIVFNLKYCIGLSTTFTLSYKNRDWWAKNSNKLWGHDPLFILENHRDVILDDLSFDWPETIFRDQLEYILSATTEFWSQSETIDSTLSKIVTECKLDMGDN